MAKSAVLFPGQGAQYVGMGKTNYERHPAAREVYERARKVLDFDVYKVSVEGPEQELARTAVSQPAIFVASAASLAAHRAAGRSLDEPVAAAGLSLGEYTALYFAGVLGLEDALGLVALRGKWMQEACDLAPSGMLSVAGLSREALEAVCTEARGGDVLVLANHNAPDQIALSGHKAALSRAEALAKARGAKLATHLKVAGAFHSPLMKPAEDRLAAEIRKVGMAEPAVPIVSNALARPVSRVDEIREALIRQLTAPVLWADSMGSLVSTGVRLFYEVGPGKVIAGLMRRIDRTTKVVSIDVVETAP